MRGAVTGIADVNMIHMLYADDLSLTANEPGQLQMMLDRLSAYALRKELIVNTSKSEVVQLNSRRTRVPVFTLGGVQLANKDSFKTWAWFSPRRTIWLLQLSICLHLSWLVVVESGSLHQSTAQQIDHTACFGWLKVMHFQQACMQVRYGALGT